MHHSAPEDCISPAGRKNRDVNGAWHDRYLVVRTNTAYVWYFVLCSSDAHESTTSKVALGFSIILNTCFYGGLVLFGYAASLVCVYRPLPPRSSNPIGHTGLVRCHRCIIPSFTSNIPHSLTS